LGCPDRLEGLLRQRHQLHLTVKQRTEEFWQAGSNAIDDVLQKGGIVQLAHLFSKAETIDDIEDPGIVALFKVFQLRLTYYLFGELHASTDAKASLKKLSRLYTLTPFTPLSLLVKARTTNTARAC